MTSEKMREIYNGLQEVIARRNAASVYTSLGYTSNLDLIPEFASEDLNRLLAAYLPDACLREMRPAGLIRNMPELLEAIPVSNRLILTRNTVNAFLPLDENYLCWVEKHAQQVSSNVLSSFNSILDPEVLEQRLARILEHVERYRSGNPRGLVYFEDAHYHDGKIRELCIETVYPHVDIVSMNEEELQYTMEMYNIPVKIDDIFSCVNGVEYLLGRFEMKRGIIVHTKDYAMYAGDASGLEIEKGMVYGSLMATARAAFGEYGSDAQIRKIMEGTLSRVGLENQEKIENSSLNGRVILVPTFALDRPKYTIGLGDCFTGGVQLCF